MLINVVLARGIPSTEFSTTYGQLRLSEISRIIIDEQYAESVDNDGETLIPPSLHEFGHTFAKDLQDWHLNVSCEHGDSADSGSIFLTLGDPNDYLDIAGRRSSEGYSLSVSENGITITGASPLGVWWGTRTVLQQVDCPDTIKHKRLLIS